MNKLLLVAIAAATLLGAGHALGAGEAAASGDSVAGVALLSIMALVLSIAAMAVGIYAALRARRTQADVARLARSIDHALRDLAEGNSLNSSTLGALTDTIDHQLGGMLDRIEVVASDHSAAPSREAPLAANNVVTLGATGRRPDARKPAAGDVAPVSWPDHGELELSLEPIIAVSQGAAACFEVYANLPFADGVARPVRRLHGEAAPAERARFELALVKAAMHASRRQLPGQAATLPLHAAISDALLADAGATAEIAQLFALHPGLAAGVVLSLPVEVLANPTRGQQKSLLRLTESSVRLAAEGWPDAGDGAAILAANGAGILKLTCNRLLDRDKLKRKAIAGGDLAEIAHARGLTIIATDVLTDEDAVALLDLGIDLMSGARFSPPRRLRAALPGLAGKAAEG